MFWIMLLVPIVIVLGGYFILNMSLLLSVLVAGVLGCLLAFVIFGLMEKDTEEKLKKQIEKKKS